MYHPKYLSSSTHSINSPLRTTPCTTLLRDRPILTIVVLNYLTCKCSHFCTTLYSTAQYILWSKCCYNVLVAIQQKLSRSHVVSGSQEHQDVLQQHTTQYLMYTADYWLTTMYHVVKLQLIFSKCPTYNANLSLVYSSFKISTELQTVPRPRFISIPSGEDSSQADSDSSAKALKYDTTMLFHLRPGRLYCYVMHSRLNCY